MRSCQQVFSVCFFFLFAGRGRRGLWGCPLFSVQPHSWSSGPKVVGSKGFGVQGDKGRKHMKYQGGGGRRRKARNWTPHRGRPTRGTTPATQDPGWTPSLSASLTPQPSFPKPSLPRPALPDHLTWTAPPGHAPRVDGRFCRTTTLQSEDVSVNVLRWIPAQSIGTPVCLAHLATSGSEVPH